MSTKHQGQHQEQGHQSQKQELSPDPVAEQLKSYKAPENALASDPITEAPKVEEPAKQPEEKKK